MNSDEFAKQLEMLRPSDISLLNSGFTYIPQYITKGYVLNKKDSKIDNERENSNVIANLFINYNLQYISFGDYNFYEEIQKTNGHFVFAASSDTILSFQTAESEIVEYDCGEWSIVGYCAKNQEAFLHALLLLLEMYSLRLQKLLDRKDASVNERYLEQCTKAAGGDRYRQFYKSVIG